MRKVIIGLALLSSFSALAKDFCTVSDLTDNKQNKLVVVNCTSWEFAADLRNNATTSVYHASNDMIELPMWAFVAKPKVINYLLRAGYKQVGCGPTNIITSFPRNDCAVELNNSAQAMD